MQITIEDISPVEKKVAFELPWSDVAPRLDRAYSNLRREVQLKGFRPGVRRENGMSEVLEHIDRAHQNKGVIIDGEYPRGGLSLG